MGRHLSEETRAKISAALRGKTKVISIEQRRKISETMTGRKLSEEHVQHLRESRVQQASKMRGRKLSEEHVQKLRESHKGHHLSEETRAKISATRKERYVINTVEIVQIKEEHKQMIVSEPISERDRKIAENIANGRPWNYGISHDEKYYAKIEANRKKREARKLIEKQEKERIKQEKARIKAEQREILKKERILHAHDNITPEEWETPMIVIAERRNITIEELNEIFFKQIKRRTLH